MDFRTNLIGELAAHRIKVDARGVTLRRQDGTEFSVAANQSPVKAVASHVHEAASRNTSFLAKLWQGLLEIRSQPSRRPSGEGTRRLFVCALKHLASESGDSEYLRQTGVHGHLCSLLLEDSARFDQKSMSRLVDYRLAIDWVTHLVAFDLYRQQLLVALNNVGGGVQGVPVKEASSFGRDFSNYGIVNSWEEATRGQNRLNDDRNPFTEEPTPLQKDRELRTDTNNERYGWLDTPDTPTLGQRYEATVKSLMPKGMVPELPTEEKNWKQNLDDVLRYDTYPGLMQTRS